jgi:hypothetical protein
MTCDRPGRDLARQAVAGAHAGEPIGGAATTARTEVAPPEPARRRHHIVKDILTSGVATACYYASRPDQRPGCQHLAVVRYGPTALCADCDRRRSAVGKGMAPVPLPDPTALVAVLVAREACARAQEALNDAVARAREAGQPWSALGTVLGTSRQAVQQRFARAD